MANAAVASHRSPREAMYCRLQPRVFGSSSQALGLQGGGVHKQWCQAVRAQRLPFSANSFEVLSARYQPETAKPAISASISVATLGTI